MVRLELKYLLVNVIVEPLITPHVSHVESLSCGGHVARYARVQGKPEPGLVTDLAVKKLQNVTEFHCC